MKKKSIQRKISTAHEDYNTMLWSGILFYIAGIIFLAIYVTYLSE